MKETLELINRMQADGVIGEHAIGGAVGAALYLERAATLAVDVFVSVSLPTSKRAEQASLRSTTTLRLAAASRKKSTV